LWEYEALMEVDGKSMEEKRRGIDAQLLLLSLIEFWEIGVIHG